MVVFLVAGQASERHRLAGWREKTVSTTTNELDILTTMTASSLTDDDVDDGQGIISLSLSSLISTTLTQIHSTCNRNDDNYDNDNDNDDYIVACSSLAALYGLRIFLMTVAMVALFHAERLFFARHGWTHRLFGALHLSWLVFGAYNIMAVSSAASSTTASPINKPIIMISPLKYDLILGVLGVLATLTAARDFPHKYVSNKVGQSGTLHRKAIVTQSEMIEHSFYQFLNLWQAMYLHTLANLKSNNNNNNNIEEANYIAWMIRLFLLWLVTAPWLFRHYLPVHSFSHNWKLAKQQHKQQPKKRQQAATNGNGNDDTKEILLYRIKKTQYLFYKHVILHGVNISMALGGVRVGVLDDESSMSPVSTSATSSTTTDATIPYSYSWRIFWLALNTSYVMEFFLQTMVKRNITTQRTMLWLQRSLMTVSSLAAIIVLRKHHVSFPVCVLSMILNVTNRHHDVFNTTMIGILFISSSSLVR